MHTGIHAPYQILRNGCLSGHQKQEHVGLNVQCDALVFSRNGEGAFKAHSVRLTEKVNQLMTGHVLPALGKQPRNEDCQDYLIPSDRPCTVAVLEPVLTRIYKACQPRDLLNYNGFLDHQQLKRFREMEDKLLVIGCGTALKSHQKSPPRESTFTINMEPDAKPDVIGRAETVIHLLPDSEHFSVIVFESVPNAPFEMGNVSISLIKKSCELLKKGGVILAYTAFGATRKDGYEGCIQILEYLTSDSNLEFKFASQPENVIENLYKAVKIEDVHDRNTWLQTIYESSAPLHGLPQNYNNDLVFGIAIRKVIPPRAGQKPASGDSSIEVTQPKR